MSDPRSDPPATLTARAESFRRFNRFFTQKIGVLNERRQFGGYTLAQARVLYEIGNRRAPTARELETDLGLDQGYLSRIVSDFERRGFVTRTPSETDARKRFLSLTPAGRAELAPLDERSRREMSEILAKLSEAEQTKLLSAMRTIERLLGGADARNDAYCIRPPRAGDLGWVLFRHGVLYAREQGWDERLESVVADVVAGYLRRHDPAREACWICERDGEPVGSVLVAAKSRTVAQLRLLLVEPEARGLGVGTRLVEHCVEFARRAGFEKLVLRTEAGLSEARRIYERAGFRKAAEAPLAEVREDLVGETWELELRPGRQLTGAGA